MIAQKIARVIFSWKTTVVVVLVAAGAGWFSVRAQAPNVTLEPPFTMFPMSMNTLAMKEHAHIPAGWKLTAASDSAIWFTDAVGNVFMIRLLKNGAQPVLDTVIYEIATESH